MKIGIVVTEYHRELTTEMLEAAKKHAAELGAEVAEIVWVPGSFEIPLAAQRMIGKVDGIAVLGYLEKGETLHGQIMGEQVARAVTDLALKNNKPVGFGIIGPSATYEQAKARTAKQAKEAVYAAVKMALAKI